MKQRRKIQKKVNCETNQVANTHVSGVPVKSMHIGDGRKKRKNTWRNNRHEFPKFSTEDPRKSISNNQNKPEGTSLVAQWLRIRLPMQGTQVRAPVREDPTCRGATKPARHNYWACALLSLRSRACEPQLLKPVHPEPVLCNKRSHCNEKPAHRNKE